MARKKTLTPKLYQRGANGNWYFRRFVNGKDKAINTGTAVRSEAEAFVKQYVGLEIEAANKEQRGELAARTAQAIMLTVRGEGIERISFEEAFKVYLDTTEDFMELSVRYRDAFISTCRKFFAWCQGNGLQYIDEVSDEIARNYARKLTDEHLSPKSFDDYIKILSKFFTTVDAMKKLPNRNPFNKVNIKRKKKGLVSEATHRPLEPEMIRKVMECAANIEEDLFDLFTIGLYTGMRLKDAALLRWEAVQENFLEIMPFKTRRYGTIARVPITGELRKMLDYRRETRGFSQYVIPAIADLYWHDSGYTVSKHSQKVFAQALGKENTVMPKGERRKVNVSIYTFGSFRTTFASLLGSYRQGIQYQLDSKSVAYYTALQYHLQANYDKVKDEWFPAVKDAFKQKHGYTPEQQDFPSFPPPAGLNFDQFQQWMLSRNNHDLLNALLKKAITTCEETLKQWMTEDGIPIPRGNFQTHVKDRFLKAHPLLNHTGSGDNPLWDYPDYIKQAQTTIKQELNKNKGRSI